MATGNWDDVSLRVKRAERLLGFPRTAANLEAARALAVAVAESAPSARLCTLALKLADALGASNDWNKALWRLRLTLEEQRRLGV